MRNGEFAFARRTELPEHDGRGAPAVAHKRAGHLSTILSSGSADGESLMGGMSPNPTDEARAGTVTTAPLRRAGAPPVSVVIPIHSEERWEVFGSALQAVRQQDPAPASVIVSVDHNLPLLRRIGTAFPDVCTVENIFERGASGTRNSGALVADTPVLVFVDSDITVDEDWMARLLEPFSNPSVVGTGGFVTPFWSAGVPPWFPDEFGWVVGVSYRGMPTETAPVRNVWSCNMAVRRDAFVAVGGFRVDFSKVGDSPKPEDTDFCVRVTRAWGGGIWMFVPDAKVHHQIGRERSGFPFFVQRCFSEGMGKVALAHLNGGRRDLWDESNYVRRAAPAGAIRYARLAVYGRDGTSLRRCAAILAGLAAAALGAVAGQARHLLSSVPTLRAREP